MLVTFLCDTLCVDATTNVVPGMSNTSDFILNKEDHTLGNLLAEYLKKHPKVLMCGYKGKLD